MAAEALVACAMALVQREICEPKAIGLLRELSAKAGTGSALIREHVNARRRKVSDIWWFGCGVSIVL